MSNIGFKIKEWFRETLKSYNYIFFILVTWTMTTGVAFFLDKKNLCLHGVTPHPYLILAIICGFFAGLTPAIFAALFFSASYFAFLHYYVDYDAVETLFAFEYLKVPVTTFILAPFIGEGRDRMRKKIDFFSKENDKYKDVHRRYKNAIQKISKEKNELLTLVVDQTATLNTFYEMSKNLEKASVDETIDIILKLMEDITHCDDYVLYLGQNIKFNLYRNHSRLDLPEVVHKGDIPPTSLLHRCLNQLETSTLGAMNLEDSDLAEDDPILCSPLIGADGNLMGFFQAFRMPFKSYNQTNFSFITISCDWLSSAIEEKRANEEAKKKAIINDHLGIYNYSYFLYRSAGDFLVAQTNMIPLTFIKLVIENFDSITPSKRDKVQTVLASLLKKSFRIIDHICLTDKPNEWVIIQLIVSEDQAKEMISEVTGKIDKFKIVVNDKGDHLKFRFDVVTYTPEMNKVEEIYSKLELRV